jgi:hypothetical protein
LAVLGLNPVTFSEQEFNIIYIMLSKSTLEIISISQKIERIIPMTGGSQRKPQSLLFWLLAPVWWASPLLERLLRVQFQPLGLTSCDGESKELSGRDLCPRKNHHPGNSVDEPGLARGGQGRLWAPSGNHHV